MRTVGGRPHVMAGDESVLVKYSIRRSLTLCQDYFSWQLAKGLPSMSYLASHDLGCTSRPIAEYPRSLLSSILFARSIFTSFDTSTSPSLFSASPASNTTSLRLDVRMRSLEPALAAIDAAGREHIEDVWLLMMGPGPFFNDGRRSCPAASASALLDHTHS
jgi:hypothetical protein